MKVLNESSSLFRKREGKREKQYSVTFFWEYYNSHKFADGERDRERSNIVSSSYENNINPTHRPVNIDKERGREAEAMNCHIHHVYYERFRLLKGKFKCQCNNNEHDEDRRAFSNITWLTILKQKQNRKQKNRIVFFSWSYTVYGIFVVSIIVIVTRLAKQVRVICTSRRVLQEQWITSSVMLTLDSIIQGWCYLPA